MILLPDPRFLSRQARRTIVWASGKLSRIRQRAFVSLWAIVKLATTPWGRFALTETDSILAHLGDYDGAHAPLNPRRSKAYAMAPANVRTACVGRAIGADSASGRATRAPRATVAATRHSS